jgi:hypothetical protein
MLAIRMYVGVSSPYSEIVESRKMQEPISKWVLGAITSLAVVAFVFFLLPRETNVLSESFDEKTKNIQIEGNADIVSRTDGTGYAVLKGNGYITLIKKVPRIEDVLVSFQFRVPSDDKLANGLLIGPSNGGWHFLIHDGKMLVQTDGGGGQMRIPIILKKGVWHQLELRVKNYYQRAFLDGRLVAHGSGNPFLVGGSSLYVGGRNHKVPLFWRGEIDAISITSNPTSSSNN